MILKIIEFNMCLTALSSSGLLHILFDRLALLLAFIPLHFSRSQTFIQSLFLLPVFQEAYPDPYHLLSDPPFCFRNTLHFSHPSSKHINHTV